MNFIIWTGAFVLLAFAVAPFCRKSAWWTDLPSHFILQWAAGTVVLALLAALLHVQGAVYWVLLGGYALCIFHLAPYLVRRRPAVPQGAGLKVLQANVLFRQKDMTRFVRLVRDESPDVVLVAESHTAAAAAYAELAAGYPFQKFLTRDDNGFGIAALSRLPFIDASVEYLVSERFPAVFFSVAVEGKETHVVSYHAANPLNSNLRDLKARDDDFAALAVWINRSNPARLIVGGDFNATPWCPAFKRLLRETGLRDARRWRGLMPSWPVKGGIPLFRIPIDHVLHRGGVAAESFRLCRPSGSDHLATVSVLRLF
jgi:endonuclease/exonuclease/phosphatase (EEP) superfamily protein YafD